MLFGSIILLYTADMPAIVKGGDDYLQCLVYADDLAICGNNLCAIQQSIDHLYKYCSGPVCMKAG